MAQKKILEQSAVERDWCAENLYFFSNLTNPINKTFVTLINLINSTFLSLKIIVDTLIDVGNRQYSYSPTALGREPSEHECEANAGTFARK